MKKIIQQYLSEKESRYSETTIEAYKHDLNVFVSFIDDKSIPKINEQDIENFLLYLKHNKNNSNTALARKLSSLKSFFKYLKKKKIITENPTIDIESPKIEQKLPSFLNTDEKNRLVNAVKLKATPYYKTRDLAILYLFLNTGIRLSELTHLKLQDVDLVNQHIKIKRKGGNEQLVPLNDGVNVMMKNYFNQRPSVNFDSFFISKKKKLTDGNVGISPSNIYQIIKKYLKYANIKKEKLSVHSLRHTVATDLVSQGVDIIYIQRLLGHKKITSTQIYTHLNDKDLIPVVNKLNINV